MKKKLLMILIVSVCFLSGCANYVKDGTELLEQGEYQEAIEEFGKAVEKEKDAPEAYRGIGMAYYEMNEYELALENLQTALDLGAVKTPAVYNLIGVCDMNLGNYSDALEAFQTGCVLAETEDEETDFSELVQEMTYNQVVCYEKMADWEGAKTIIREYISLYPDDAEAQKEAEFLETR